MNYIKDFFVGGFLFLFWGLFWSFIAAFIIGLWFLTITLASKLLGETGAFVYIIFCVLFGLGGWVNVIRKIPERGSVK